MTTIKIEIKDNTITVDEPIIFNPIELPYGAVGYRNNGTSTSPIENLDAYWSFVDELLSTINVPSSDYITLKNITIDGNFYGIFE